MLTSPKLSSYYSTKLLYLDKDPALAASYIVDEDVPLILEQLTKVYFFFEVCFTRTPDRVSKLLLLRTKFNYGQFQNTSDLSPFAQEELWDTQHFRDFHLRNLGTSGPQLYLWYMSHNIKVLLQRFKSLAENNEPYYFEELLLASFDAQGYPANDENTQKIFLDYLKRKAIEENDNSTKIPSKYVVLVRGQTYIDLLATHRALYFNEREGSLRYSNFTSDTFPPALKNLYIKNLAKNLRSSHAQIILADGIMSLNSQGASTFHSHHTYLEPMGFDVASDF